MGKHFVPPNVQNVAVIAVVTAFVAQIALFPPK